MSVLLAAICFEGLGRIFLVDVPSVVFWVAKDVVLVSAVVVIGIKPDVVRVARSLYGRAAVALAIAMVWTLLEFFNPEQASLELGLLGLRCYWLWWLAPVLIASAIQRVNQRNRIGLILALYTIFIALYASAQFASPPDASINAYALYNGETVQKTASVYSTGRARVSGTFSFLSGFADFGIFAPVILLGLGLDAPRRTRLLSVVAAIMIASTVAMAGSRKGLILCLVGIVILLWRSELVRSRNGRGAFLLMILVALFSLVRGTVAIDGVMSRFDGADTGDRVANELLILPPVALATADYPVFGIGTGMQQSARIPLGFTTNYGREEEFTRILVELGVIGYTLLWIARVGLIMALWRASVILKRDGQMGTAGAATALAFLTMFNSLVFDHVSQALYFVGLGIILSTTVTAVSRSSGGSAAVRSR